MSHTVTIMSTGERPSAEPADPTSMERRVTLIPWPEEPTSQVHSPTVRRRVGPTILLQSGNYFDFAAPEDCTFTIEDVAHGLANTCRFTGQCSRFYSVAQHSVHVAEILAPAHRLAGLLHDATEAFIGDVSKPLKDMLPDYRALEKRIEAVVAARFGVPVQMHADVKDADVQMLATEQHQLMPDREGRSYAGGKEPAARPLPTLNPEQAKAWFLEVYADLTNPPRQDRPAKRYVAAPEVRRSISG